MHGTGTMPMEMAAGGLHFTDSPNSRSTNKRMEGPPVRNRLISREVEGGGVKQVRHWSR